MDSPATLTYTQTHNRMIDLHRLKGEPFVLNADWIKTVESCPDTRIVLLNGEVFLVQESVTEVTERVIRYRRQTGAHA